MKQTFNIYRFSFEVSGFKSFLVICVLCFAVYGNSIFNDYSLNDTTVVSNNKFVKEGLAGIPDIVSNSYQYFYSNSTAVETDYRPLAEVTLAIEYQFFGLNPHVSHFVNILLYILLCSLLYMLLVRFKLNHPYPYLPLLITCFFIVHTAHTEVVDSIKNREEILALLFGLGALIFAFNYYTGYRAKAINLLGVIICLFLSFASKISAAPLVGVIILMAYQFGPQVSVRKALFWTLPLALIVNYLLHLLGLPATIAFTSVALAVVYVYRDNRDIKFNVLLVYLILGCLEMYLALQDSFGSRQASAIENPLTNDNSLVANIALALDSLWFYFKFMLLPHPCRFYYGSGSIQLHQLVSAIPIFSFIIHTCLLAYACYALWYRRLIGFIIVSYFICIFHYSNFFSKYTGVVSERALFVPGIWFIAAFLIIIVNLTGNDKKTSTGVARNYLWIPLAGLFLLYSVLTIQRNSQWKDYLTLYASDIDNLKNSVVPNMMYADMLRTTGAEEKSEPLRKLYLNKSGDYYRHVLSLAPDNSFAYFGLGQLYRYAEGKVDSGCGYFHTAYLLDSTQSMQKFQAARCKLEGGEIASARLLLSDLFIKMPEDTFVLFYYARSLFLTGDTTSARRVNSILLKQNFSPTFFYVNEAYFNGVAGNMQGAADNFEKAMSFGYRDEVVFNLLLNYYLNTNQSKKANDLQRFGNTAP